MSALLFLIPPLVIFAAVIGGILSFVLPRIRATKYWTWLWGPMWFVACYWTLVAELAFRGWVYAFIKPRSHGGPIDPGGGGLLFVAIGYMLAWFLLFAPSLVFLIVILVCYPTTKAGFRKWAALLAMISALVLVWYAWRLNTYPRIYRLPLMQF
jgi:hypothetical protein